MNTVKLSRVVLTIACAASGLAAIGAGTCVYKINLGRTACSMTIINDCPVLVHLFDGICEDVALGTSGFKSSDPYSQSCSYQAQKKNLAGDCEPLVPPVYGVFTQQCNRAKGDGCKQH